MYDTHHSHYYLIRVRVPRCPLATFGNVGLFSLSSISFIIRLTLLPNFVILHSASYSCFMITDLLIRSSSSCFVTRIDWRFFGMGKMPFLGNICLSLSRNIFSRKYYNFMTPTLFFMEFLSHASKIEVFPLFTESITNLTYFRSTEPCYNAILATSDILTGTLTLGNKVLLRVCI
jgi:hypothetical protein